MDPVAMMMTASAVDPIALQEANALATKKYLVYLDMIVDIPMPNSEWCRYNVFPVATTLRPENPDIGITREMVLPIHPNQAHLVVPSPFVCQQDPAHSFEFKFKDCFLWAYSDTVLRLRVKHDNGGYDNSKAVSLTSGQHCEMTNSFGPHLDRITEYIQKQGRGTSEEDGEGRKVPLSRSLTAARTGTPSMPPQPEFDAIKGRLPVVLDAEDDRPDRGDQSSLRNLSR